MDRAALRARRETGILARPFGLGFGFYSPIYWRAFPPAHYFVRPGVVAAMAPAARAAAPAMRSAAPMGGTMRAPVGGMTRGGRR